MKTIIISVITSLVISLLSIWGYNRYQEHKTWVDWKKEQDVKAENQIKRGQFNKNLETLYNKNLIKITNVVFGDKQTAKITGKLNEGFTAKRVLVAGSCDYFVSPRRSVKLSDNGFFTINVNYVGGGDADGGKRRDFTFYPSRFTSWEEIKALPIEYLQYSNSGKIQKDKTLPYSVRKDQGDEFLYETTNAGSAPEPDFCESDEMIMNIPTSLGLDFVSKTFKAP